MKCGCPDGILKHSKKSKWLRTESEAAGSYPLERRRE